MKGLNTSVIANPTPAPVVKATAKSIQEKLDIIDGKKAAPKKAKADKVAKTKPKAAKPAEPKKAPKTPVVKAPSDRGVIKAQIVAAANKAYAGAGSDKLTLKEIMQLRVTVMNDLQVQGVKRTTASCMLGEWQKLLPAHQHIGYKGK